ncbi:MAG: hypothetical protein ACM3SV_01150 [Betaproteobacteria bacterium]
MALISERKKIIGNARHRPVAVDGSMEKLEGGCYQGKGLSARVSRLAMTSGYSSVRRHMRIGIVVESSF